MISSDPGFGVYVHWPFCKAKCPYCDFNSHVRHDGVDAMSFGRALATELAWLAAQTGERTVSSIFFGGGTPSLMPPAAVGEIIERIAQLWTVAADAEVTLEANPTSAEARNFTGYRAAGVNRLSVGVQALDDHDLRGLGRRHTANEALAAFRLAASIFPRVSFDMIYARPNQTAAAWRKELSRALSEQRGHMSLYQLTIEPGTAFGDLYARGRFPVLPEEQASDLYFITQELTEKAGLPAYEVSNHAVPGHEARHNLLYWRYGEYAGAGPGAHSRIGAGSHKRALVAEKHPETWRDMVQSRGHGMVEDAAVALGDQALEYLLMGMRIRDGIDLNRHAALAGEPIAPAKICGLESLGLVRRNGDRLSATRRGQPLLNAVIAELAS
jgi:oxygen-independent coproporphyrinogen-3 oxidase